jgi:hypothetical protein
VTEAGSIDQWAGETHEFCRADRRRLLRVSVDRSAGVRCRCARAASCEPRRHPAKYGDVVNVPEVLEYRRKGSVEEAAE